MSSSTMPRARASGSGSASASGSNSSQTPNQSVKRSRYGTAPEEYFDQQAPEEKIRLTAQFRDLMSKAEETKADLANRTFDDMRAAVRAGEVLFKATKDTGIAALDARLMQSTVESAVAMARKNRVAGGSFNIDEFLIRVQGVLGLDRLEREDMSPSSEDELEDSQAAHRTARKGRLGDWEKVGWLAAKHTRRVPGVEFMYGPLAVEHTKRVTQKRARRRSVGVEQRPQELQTQARQKGEKAAADDMVHNVMTVQKLLEEKDQGEGINFLELVINPDDYGQTVENIFYASFLIKEGSAGIQVDEDGQVIIRNESDKQMEETGDVPKNQAVIELDMNTWREAIQLFNITKPLIPHRHYQIQRRPGAGAWYS